MRLPTYPEYKESGVEWLGAMPSDWQLVRLKNVATLVMGQSPSSESYNQDGVGAPFLQGNADFGSVAPSPRHYCDSATKTAEIGDVLLSVRAPVGAINVADQVYGIGRGLCAIRSSSKLNSQFLRYAAEVITKELLSVATGSTYESVSVEQVASAALVLPRRPEQEAIAKFLDHEIGKIDALVAEQERLLTLLAEKRQATISYAVTRGLNHDAPMNDSGIDWIGPTPAHWKLAKLAHFASVENGTTPSRAVPEYWTGGDVAWLASGEVNQFNVTRASEFITKAALEQCSLRLLPEGTVIVGMIGEGKTRGMSAILRIPAAINQNLAAICPREHILGQYVLFLFHAIYVWLREAGRGGNQAAMNCEILASLRIPVPPLAEQQEIVSFIEDEAAKLDALKTSAEQAIALLKERRSALIAAAVTGQIDVRGARAPQAEEEQALAA